MVTTVQRKRLHVLVDAPLMRRIRDVAEAAGISGYTLMPTIGGGGDQGRWQAEDVTGGAGNKVLFTTVTDDEGTERLLAELEPMLDEYGLMVTVTDVEVIRGDRFASAAAEDSE